MQAYSKKQCTRGISSRLNLSFDVLLHIFEYLEDAQGIGTVQQLCRFTRLWKNDAFEGLKIEYVVNKLNDMWEAYMTEENMDEDDREYWERNYRNATWLPRNVDALKQMKEIELDVNAFGGHDGNGDAFVVAKILKMNIRSLVTVDLDMENGDPIRYTEEGLKAIASALKNNTSVRSFAFGLTSYNRVDGVLMALCDALKQNTTLRTIDLGAENAIDCFGTYKLEEEYVEKCPHIITNAGARALAEVLRVNASLNNIDLDQTKIGDEGVVAIMEALWSSVSLRSKIKVRISTYYHRRDSVTMGVIDYMVAHRDRFAFNFTEFTVWIWINGHRDHEIVIDGLYLPGDSDDLLNVKLLWWLEEESMSSRCYDDEEVKIITEIWKEKAWKSVTLSSVTDEGAKAIAEALKGKTSLKELNIHGSFCVEGVKAIALALEENKTVTQLCIESEEMGDEAARVIGEMLKRNTSLTKIEVTFGTDLGEEGASHLAKALKVNTTLKGFNLYGRNITLKGGKQLASAWEENGVLDFVNVGGLGINRWEYICLTKELYEKWFHNFCCPK